MGFMVSAGDLLTLYIGLEIQSLAAYVMASFMRTHLTGVRRKPALNIIVLGALASGILLYGVSLLYGFSGTTSYRRNLRRPWKAGLSTGELFGLVFVLAGLAFKVSAVPFHMWTPDVYEGAPTPVTAYLRMPCTEDRRRRAVDLPRDFRGARLRRPTSGSQIVIFVAIASIVLGAVAAIGQTNIKRLIGL